MSTQDHPPLITLRGELVSLGPLHQGFIEPLTRWYNDPTTLLLGGDDLSPTTESRSAASWSKIIDEENEKRVFFGIYENAGMLPIGMCNIRDINTMHRTGEYGISIGEAEYRGRGRGTEATTLLLDYAFTVFGLENVWLDTLSVNIRAIRSYEKAGFKEIGRRRAAHRIGSNVYDIVLMDCIASEFYATRTSVIPNPF
jgi:diamine N-acetyltransferase